MVLLQSLVGDAGEGGHAGGASLNNAERSGYAVALRRGLTVPGADDDDDDDAVCDTVWYLGRRGYRRAGVDV